MDSSCSRRNTDLMGACLSMTDEIVQEESASRYNQTLVQVFYLMYDIESDNQPSFHTTSSYSSLSSPSKRDLPQPPPSSQTSALKHHIPNSAPTFRSRHSSESCRTENALSYDQYEKHQSMLKAPQKRSHSTYGDHIIEFSPSGPIAFC